MRWIAERWVGGTERCDACSFGRASFEGFSFLAHQQRDQGHLTTCCLGLRSKVGSSHSPCTNAVVPCTDDVAGRTNDLLSPLDLTFTPLSRLRLLHSFCDMFSRLLSRATTLPPCGLAESSATNNFCASCAARRHGRDFRRLQRDFNVLYTFDSSDRACTHNSIRNYKKEFQFQLYNV